MTAGLSRTEVTRFPHAVLDVRLTFPATHTLPPWLQVSLSCHSQRLVRTWT